MNNTVNNRTFSFGKLFLLSFMQLMFRCLENLGLEKGNLSLILMPRNREIWTPYLHSVKVFCLFRTTLQLKITDRENVASSVKDPVGANLWIHLRAFTAGDRNSWQNQGKRKVEGTINWKILCLWAKNSSNGVVLERTFIWWRFQRLSPLQKLSFSQVDTRYPIDRILRNIVSNWTIVCEV